MNNRPQEVLFRFFEQPKTIHMNIPANLIDKNSNEYSSLLTRCEQVFNEIKEGHEKEARENFPLEYYLVNKYLYHDLPGLMQQLERRLTF